MKRTSSMHYEESAEAEELYLFAVNDSTIFNVYIRPLVKRLKSYHKKGIYDDNRAVDGFYNVATQAAKMYIQQYCTPGYRFTVTHKFTAAVKMAEYSASIIGYNFGGE